MEQSSDNADVLVLACTHYPLIAPLLRRITPERVKIVDSAESTARVVRQLLLEQSPQIESRNPETVRPDTTSDHRSFRFFVTDSVDKFKRLATGFLGRQVDHVEHVDL